MPSRAKKKNGSDKPKRYYQLPVEMTADELADRTQQLVALLDEIDAQKAALKDYTKGERDEIKGKEQDALKLREAVSSGAEVRDVEVDLELRSGTVFVTRLDTGEVVDQRPATDEDRQQGLFG